MIVKRTAIFLGVLLLVRTSLEAQPKEAATWAAEVLNDYRVVPNVTYLTANNWEAKLDLYARRDITEPVPVIIHIHGGGWVGGIKEADVLALLPYFQLRLAVVNVEYRLGRISPPPAAVEDCRCALQWVIQHAEEYRFDTSRIVVTGGSAGGHLALMTGMLPSSAGLDRQCRSSGELPVAGIINWYGITDVADLLDGPNMKDYAVRWFGGMEDRVTVAKRISPLTYVRPGLPPIMTIHGDEDAVVPYSHAVRLHRELDRVGVVNRLFTVTGGGHGGFSSEERVKIHEAIREFLAQLDVVPRTGKPNKP
jgi:acetyl esterase/lipase